MTPSKTSSLLRRSAMLMALAALTACGDSAVAPSTESDTVDLAATASGFDQEAARATDRGDAERATAFRAAAAALRFGVRPSVIAIGVNGETHRFSAVVTATVEVLADQDTALRRTLVAWRGERGPVEILRVITLGNQGTFSSEEEPASNPRARAHGLLVNLERDSRWLATAGSAGIAIGDTGGACIPLTRGDAALRCVRAVFGFDVDGLFRLGGSAPDEGLAAVRVIAQTQRVSGVIIALDTSR